MNDGKSVGDWDGTIVGVVGFIMVVVEGLMEDDKVGLVCTDDDIGRSPDGLKDGDVVPFLR